MSKVTGCSGPKQIANRQIRQSNDRREGAAKKIRHLFDLVLKCFEEVRGPDGRWLRATTERGFPLVRHRFLPGFFRPEIGEANEVRNRRAIHRTQGDQFVDVAWEEIACLDIGKRT